MKEKFSGEAVGIAIWNIALSKLQKQGIDTCAYVHLHKGIGAKHIPPCTAGYGFAKAVNKNGSV